MSVTNADGLPRIWGRVPPRNPHFTGREDLLLSMREQFTDSESPVTVATLSGLGGIGKTQLAIEYVYRYLAEYDAVWWVSADSVERVQESLAELAHMLGVVLEDRTDPAAVIETLVRGFPTQRWLMVFDNVRGPDEVMPFVPQGPGHVIITSRHARWTLAASPLEVDLLGREEGIDLLRRSNPELTEHDADRLAEALSDLPLAITQAATWLTQTGMPVDHYLEELEAARTRQSPNSSDSPLDAAWWVSLDRLRDTDPAALWVLRLCAFFEVRWVQRALLRPVADTDSPPELDKVLRDPLALSHALRSISRFALARINHGDNTLELHDLVRARIREQVSDDERTVLARLAEVLEGRVGTDVDWSTDAPAEVDLLKRDALAQVLADRIQETRQRDPRTSLLVHLDGAWGTGKSTLLNLLGKRLTTAGFLVVWFDAWQHSRLSPPWWALLTTVRRHIASDRGWWARRWLHVRETAARARRSGAPYLLAVFLLLVLAGGIALVVRWGIGAVQQPAEFLKALVPALAALGVLWTGARIASRMLLWNSARGARLFEQSDTNPMVRVAEHFDWLLQRSRKPVVFFIDDLDRCKDEYVVELLEAAQTLVRDAPRVHGGINRLPPAAYFVVAADGSWLRRAYTRQYGDTDTLGYQFLDKLFQLTVPMPTLSTTSQRLFLGRLLGLETDAAADPSQIAEARSRIEEANGNEELILGALNETEQNVRNAVTADAARAVAAAETRAHTEHALRKFAPLLSPNPRSTKLFLNSYTILRAVRTLEGITVDTDTLALWTIIRIRWPRIADFLQRNPDAIKGILEPLWCSELFPTELHETAKSEELRLVATHPQGGPLSAAAIRECCGTA
ncbi:FxSxx-COOH system tetratricopeptide repeat protein [Saccharopolyspora shandongensis]|uniref:FxSxx-COOH system tetratricopeptide repeat protein n=1 Tax=Saccharopolyspora shandongensis TaxID=418495 RepID=UPI003445CDAC